MNTQAAIFFDPTTPPPNPSQNTQEAQTQLTEVLTQPFTQNDDSCLSPTDAIISPVVVNRPRWWGKLIPCSSSESSCSIPIQLAPKNNNSNTGAMTEDTYSIGRSLKCDVQVEQFARNNGSDHQKQRAEWAYGLISNRHCILTCNNKEGFKVSDCSGNGTAVNDTILRKGEELSLSSGDEISLLNPTIVKRKIRGAELQTVLQEYSFIFVPNNFNLLKPPSAAVRVRSLARSMERSPPQAPLYPPARMKSPKELSIAADYEMGSVLGTGTVGEVRKAVHKRTGDQVAVKILSRSQLAAEASILRQLSHPYVVRLIDVYHETHTVFLVMELMDRDLFSCIVEKERYKEPEARFVMRRLLAALHYLHEEAQVVHRDLKPENILLRGQNEIKLTDFGLAKQDCDGRLQTFCGTPQYFAPEVLDRAHTVLGHGRYGKPADLWSVGVILYVMLTGCTPQFGPQSMIVWDGADEHTLSEAARELIIKLLDPNPSSRLTVSQACDHHWMLVDDKDHDTHVHPLDDPVLKKRKTDSTKEAVSSKDVVQSKTNEAVSSVHEGENCVDAVSLKKTSHCASSSRENDPKDPTVHTATQSKRESSEKCTPFSQAKHDRKHPTINNAAVEETDEKPPAHNDEFSENRKLTHSATCSPELKPPTAGTARRPLSPMNSKKSEAKPCRSHAFISDTPVNGSSLFKTEAETNAVSPLICDPAKMIATNSAWRRVSGSAERKHNTTPKRKGATKPTPARKKAKEEKRNTAGKQTSLNSWLLN